MIKGYKASTHEKFRVILKVFYKVVYGNNEIYPDCVKWFSVTVGKEIKSKEKALDIKEYLEEEIPILIENASTLQKKAFLACLYESGSRPEEFLRLSNLLVYNKERNNFNLKIIIVVVPVHGFRLLVVVLCKLQEPYHLHYKDNLLLFLGFRLLLQLYN